jgi:hypothetical protein
MPKRAARTTRRPKQPPALDIRVDADATPGNVLEPLARLLRTLRDRRRVKTAEAGRGTS